MQKTDLSDFIVERYRGLVCVDAWGEQSFFYNPQGRLPRGVYFATLKDKDGDNDKASELDREGVFRFNFGVSQSSYEKALGARPARPAAGCAVTTGDDFTRLNTLLPHPVYAWMSWVCVLNPDQRMIANLVPLLDESYDLVTRKYAKRIRP